MFSKLGAQLKGGVTSASTSAAGKASDAEIIEELRAQVRVPGTVQPAQRHVRALTGTPVQAQSFP